MLWRCRPNTLTWLQNSFLFQKRWIFFPLCHQVILCSKSKGDSQMNSLRSKGQSLREQQILDESRKQEVDQTVRETEEQWRRALQTAEEALDKAETQALLDKDLVAFETQKENVQSWIRDQEQNLQAAGGQMQVEEKLRIARVSLKLCRFVMDVMTDDFKEHVVKACFLRTVAYWSTIFVFIRPL